MEARARACDGLQLQLGCPCSFESPPTYGTCEAALAYHIVKGSCGRTALDGLLWLTAARWPGALHERNGRAVVFLDESASDGQRRALEAIATGKVGGPIGIFMSTVTAGIQVRSARISFEWAGKNTSFGVQGSVDVDFEPIRNPVTGEEHYASTLLNAGMLNKREDHYSVKRLYVDTGGLKFSYQGRNAFTSQVIWAVLRRSGLKRDGASAWLIRPFLTARSRSSHGARPRSLRRT